MSSSTAICARSVARRRFAEGVVSDAKKMALEISNRRKYRRRIEDWSSFLWQACGVLLILRTGTTSQVACNTVSFSFYQGDDHHPSSCMSAYSICLPQIFKNGGKLSTIPLNREIPWLHLIILMSIPSFPQGQPSVHCPYSITG